MKISEISITDLIENAREEIEDEEIIKAFTLYGAGARAFIRSYTGLSDEQIDEKEDLSIAYHVLVNEMHENRIYTVDNDKVNPVVHTILNMHSINLL